jgi:hypothetical protein
MLLAHELRRPDLGPRLPFGSNRLKPSRREKFKVLAPGAMNRRLAFRYV